MISILVREELFLQKEKCAYYFVCRILNSFFRGKDFKRIQKPILKVLTAKDFNKILALD